MALELAIKKFRGVSDMDGEPYVLHLLRVMMAQDTKEAMIAGLLHDIVEDTEVTLDDLRTAKIPDNAVEAIDCLTHRETNSYAEYVVGLAKNDIARNCKLADLNDNYRLERVVYREGHVERDRRRLQRYVLSYQFLQRSIDEATYRRLMDTIE